MNYIVMECHPGYVVLLDEEGRFLKAANLHYQVGQTVRDPVLMKEGPARRPVRWISGGIAAAAACLLFFFGFGYYQNYLMPYSSIYLVINPEVQMNLNRQGTVVSLVGTNEDGVALLEGYDGRGKDKVTVADELVDRAIEMGFLSEGGRVSFSIDAPDEVLFQEYGIELRTGITEHLDGRIMVTIELAASGAGGAVTESSITPESSAESSAPVSSAEPAEPAIVPSAPADTDYGPGNDGVTDYSDTDYGAGSDGVTDYTPPASSAPASADTDYGPGNDGVTDYSDTDYGAGSDGVTDYSPSSADSGYGGDSGYADDDGDDSDDSDDDSDDDDDD
ncbi:MAG TPA: hypothetical protein IAB55_04735 [Candidatus Merdivicinus faecavium]|nr:hypothetical protein [Candidatus Merdivicinus faecavium]